ncbi:MAG: Co2+/Mg2+ efflux protein ApaG [Casimicrobiaceae bacterium]
MDDKQYEISVSVRTAYLADRSEPSQSQYVFAYTVTLTNSGAVPAQLISRHWIITDANNTVQEVRGLGVVGQQPLLQPGEAFEYTSGATLATPMGTMQGSYQMVGEDGRSFETPIPQFTLSVPRVLH